MSGLDELREAIEAELALLPDEARMTQFDMGAAAAYSYVLSVFPTASDEQAVIQAARAFLAAAQLESMTKAPEYIAAKRKLRAALREPVR